MSCVDLTPAHIAVLAALADRRPVQEGMGDVFDELVSWGWVMRSGELTGIGHRHAGAVGRGMLG